VPDRTLRRWIRVGLLPGPLGSGRASYYEATHVTRARAIEALRQERLSTRAIRDRLATASAQELERLGAPRTTALKTAPHPPAPPSYPATAWEVVDLSDGLVLLVRTDKLGARRLANEIYRHYHG
jgi:DNA-binding transcriptional MerR regulator